MRILLLLFLSSCVYGLSAARSVYPEVYCQPIHEDVQICRNDYGDVWRCVNEHGYWVCRSYQ